MSEIRSWASEAVARELRVKGRDLAEVVEYLTWLISCAKACRSGYPEPPGCTKMLGKVVDYLCLLDPRVLRDLSRILEYRYSSVLKTLAELEHYSTWKKGLVKVYVERYGPGRFKVKSVRKGGRVYEYLVFERYSDSRTFIVEDPGALKLFKDYLRAKRVARSTVEHYTKLLGKLAKLGDPLAVKASRVLLKEASELRSRVRACERLS